MAEHRVQQGDTIQAVHVNVDGMHQAAPVWVVVTDAGLVRCVAQPPVARAGALWPSLVNLVTEPT